MTASPSPKWPKLVPALTAEQQRISDDFMRYWHEVLPRRFGAIEGFNHGYPVRRAPAAFTRTLEIGAGLGEHLAYERLTPEQTREYVAVDIRPNMVARLRERFPAVQAVVADCQKPLPYPDGHFDRVLAIHVLEHLPDLPAAVRELHRLCHKERGTLAVVMPCEGGMAYTLARRISAQRLFEKRYGQPYAWLIAREHINRPAEIVEELRARFTVGHRRFFPLIVPMITLNLCVGLTLRPKT